MSAERQPAVFVTGAAGFIGRHTVKAFLESGWAVTGLVHRRTHPELERMAQNAGDALRLERGDMTDAGEIARILMDIRRLQGGRPVIAHCAGRASDVGRDADFRLANYDSVRILGQAVCRGLATRLVFVSTTDVYGIRDHDCALEDQSPLEAFPPNPYPRYKIKSERWIRKSLCPECWSIVRPAAVWGPDDETLTRRAIDFLRLSPVIVHFGPWRGRNRWPLAHVSNVAAAIVIAAADAATSGQSVNVIDSEITTIDEFYRLLAEVFFPGKRFRTWCLPFFAGLPWAWVVSGVSSWLNLDRPFIDPSVYALHSVSRNLSFSNRRWLELMRRHGRTPVTRDEGLAGLR